MIHCPFSSWSERSGFSGSQLHWSHSFLSYFNCICGFCSSLLLKHWCGLTLSITSSSGLHDIKQMLRSLNAPKGGSKAVTGLKGCPVRRGWGHLGYLLWRRGGQEVTLLLSAAPWGGEAKGDALLLGTSGRTGNSTELHQGMIILGAGKHSFTLSLKQTSWRSAWCPMAVSFQEALGQCPQ